MHNSLGNHKKPLGLFNYHKSFETFVLSQGANSPSWRVFKVCSITLIILSNFITITFLEML